MIGERDTMTPEGRTTTEALLLDHFAALAAATGGVAKLRELILQLAVQGKLVPQDPDDEPAAALLERIAAEKKRLVKEGKIRKAKPLPPVREDEVSYAVPEGWVWTRLEEIGIINPRNQGVPEDMEASFVPMSLISEKYGVKVCSERRKWKEIKSGGYTHFANNDVVCAKITPCFQNGKSAVMDGLIGGIGAGTTELHVFHSYYGLLDSFYVLIYLKSPNFISNGISKMTGSAGQKRVPREYFSRNPFPLPPLPEQHRIVEKVDALMKLCDELEARQAVQKDTHAKLGTAALAALSEAEDAAAFEDAWSLVAENVDLIFDSRKNVAALRQTVLQLAVEGKLVPQNPADEPAAVLLERIAAEKRRLVKEGKIRKAKPLPPVEEVPFEAPEGWVWTKLGSIIRFGPKNGYSSVAVDNPSKTKCLTLTATTSGSFNPNYYKYVDENVEDGSYLWLENDDLLIQRGNSLDYVGISAVYSGPSHEFIYPDLMMKIRFSEDIDVHFASKVINSPFARRYFMQKASGTANSMPKVNQTIVNNLTFPLPPLPEQHRIVEKVDALMKLCDELDARIAEREEVGTKLIASVVAGAC